MNNTGRTLVYLIFVYTCVEGLVINIRYPDPLPYIYKDVLIAFVYLGLMMNQRPSSGSLGRVSTPMVVFSIIMLAYLVMPTRVGPLAAAVAVKLRLFYVGLAFVGYHFTRDVRDLTKLLTVMAWAAIPVSLFGVYLFFEGPQALWRLGANYSYTFYSTSGEAGINFWRVPGTFNSPAQFGAYLSWTGALLVGLLLVEGLPKRNRLVVWVAVLLIIAALLVSGSRAPLLYFFLSSSLVVLMMGKLSRLGGVAVIAYGVTVVAYEYFGGGVGDRVMSIATMENVDRFTGSAFGQVFLAPLAVAPMGIGLGVATIGARHFSEWTSVMLVESYLGLLAVETGVLGVLVFSWLALAISRVFVSARPFMKRAPVRSLWYAIAIVVLLSIVTLPQGTALDTIPVNLYFWFFMGAGIKLYDLERWRLAWQRSHVEPATAPAYAGYIPGQVIQPTS